MTLCQFPNQLVLKRLVYAIPQLSPVLLYIRQVLGCGCARRSGGELGIYGVGEGGVEFVEAVYGAGDAVEGYAF